jgi:predicted ATPase
LGYPERAIEDANRALEDARMIKHDATIMYVLANTIWFHLLSGNYGTVESQSHELVEMAAARGAKFWILAGKLFLECQYILEESNFDRSNKFYATIEEFRSTGSTAWIPFYYSLLALSYSKTHLLDEAKQYIDEAILAMEISGQRWLESELHRTAAVIALAPVEGDVIRAQYHLEKALAVARSQQARSLELRAATSLARLWRHQGKAVEGREVLSPVYNWFTEGFDTPDLKEAKALLDELRA